MSLIVILALPILAATVSFVAPKRSLASVTTIASACAVFGLSLAAALSVSSSGTLIAVPGWISIDGLGALMLLLISFVGMVAAVFSIGHLDRARGGEHQIRHYYANYNLFLFSILAIPLFSELSMVWTVVELTTLFSVFLVGFSNDRPALEAAWKYAALTLMGAAIALLGFLILAWGLSTSGGGAYTWDGVRNAAPHMPPALLGTAFLLILVGFGTKVGLVPLHTWLPDAHSQAPSPVCLLLSGVETSAILYVLLRLIPISSSAGLNAGVWAEVFGLLSVATAAFLLLQVRDYKRLFAFSTVEHMGIILTAVGIGKVAAYGTVYQLLSHALTKSFAFLVVGVILLAFGTRRIRNVRGLISISPLAGASLLIAGLAIGGAPPFVVFLSEFSIMKAGISAGSYVVVSLLALFVGIAFFGIMWHIGKMAFGTPPDGIERAKITWSEHLALAAAGIPVLFLGVYMPEPLYKLLHLAAAALTR